MTKKNKVFAQCTYLILIAVGIGAVSFADEPNDEKSETEKATDSNRNYIEPEKTLAKSEIAFLNCSLKCQSGAIDGSLFQCLDDCQKDTRIPPKNISNIMSISVGTGVTEDECVTELGRSGFVCPVFSVGCRCEGFFDCVHMALVVKGCKINDCNTDPNGREICFCKLR